MWKQGTNIEYRYRSLDSAKIEFTKKNYLEKDYDERYEINMSNNQKSDKIYQISKNDEEKVTEDIEVLKLWKLSSQKNIDNIEK